MLIQSGAQVNSLFWIKSLMPNDEGSTRRVLEDLEPFLRSKGVAFEMITPQTGEELLLALKDIEQRAKAGVKPIIHFDTHGGPDAGLYIVPSDEFVGWDVLAESLREINVATGNNLCVISAACYGQKQVDEVTVLKPVPFYLLIGTPNWLSRTNVICILPGGIRDR